MKGLFLQRLYRGDFEHYLYQSNGSANTDLPHYLSVNSYSPTEVSKKYSAGFDCLAFFRGRRLEPCRVYINIGLYL